MNFTPIQEYILTNRTDELIFSENHGNWSCTYFAQITKNFISLKIVSIKPFFGEVFGQNTLSNNKFISFFAKYANFNLTSNQNMYTDHLLSDSNALNLLLKRKAILELDEHLLTYSCKINKTETELIFEILEMHHALLDEITRLCVIRSR
jgi:hypothetical protein